MFRDSTVRFETLSATVEELKKAKAMAEHAAKKQKMEAKIAERSKLASELKAKAEEAAAASLAQIRMVEEMQQELEAMNQDPPIFVSETLGPWYHHFIYLLFFQTPPAPPRLISPAPQSSTPRHESTEPDLINVDCDDEEEEDSNPSGSVSNQIQIWQCLFL